MALQDDGSFDWDDAPVGSDGDDDSGEDGGAGGAEGSDWADPDEGGGD